MKNKNAGFSLVELIIVVAIIAVLVGVAARWIGNISGYRAKECASKISSNLTATKVKSLSKAVNNTDVKWRLYQDSSDNCYYIEVTTIDRKSGSPVENKEVSKVSKGRVEVYFIDAAGSDHLVTSISNLTLYYNRNTGALITDSGSTADIKGVKVKGGRRTYSFDIVPATGKVSSKLNH